VNVLISTILGAATSEAIVCIQIDDRKPIQITAEDARSLALHLIQAAEAAEQDKFIFSFGKRLGDNLDAAGAALLEEFRKFRQ
jgi:hypothetical protein